MEQGKDEKYYSGNGRISTLDGLSIDFDDWWFNIRGSNTEPLLRVNIEAVNKQLMNKKFREIANLIKKFS